MDESSVPEVLRYGQRIGPVKTAVRAIFLSLLYDLIPSCFERRAPDRLSSRAVIDLSPRSFAEVIHVHHFWRDRDLSQKPEDML